MPEDKRRWPVGQCPACLGNAFFVIAEFAIVTARRPRLARAAARGNRAARAALLLVQDLHIRVINADTGELLRELVLDPSKSYQATGRRPGWPKKNTTNPT